MQLGSAVSTLKSCTLTTRSPDAAKRNLGKTLILGFRRRGILERIYMSLEATQVEQTHRANIIRQGLNLEYLTIAYNSLEGLIAIVAGLIAGSIALIGFGFDSVIEVTSGTALLWRLHADIDEEWRERVEAIT